MSAPVAGTAAASTYAAATSISVALPPSLVNGNLLIVVVSTRGSNNTFTLTDVDPTWRALLQSAGAQCEIFWKFVNGTEPVSVTVSWGSSAAAVAFAIQVSGVTNLGAPIEAANQAATTSTNIVMTALTAKASTDLLIAVFVANVATAITVPGSMASILGSTTGNSRCVNGASETLSANGSTGTRTATVGSSVANHAIGIIIREPIAAIELDFPDNVTDVANAGVIGNGATNGTTAATTIDGTVTGRAGFYKVSGHTKQIDTLDPLYRSVMLLSADGRQIIRGAMSVADDGSYSFTHLAAGDYVVVGIDQNGVQNGVIAAKIAAVAM